jgi:hypothetical protein
MPQTKEYPYILDTSDGTCKRFDTLEHAIACAETLYNRWQLSVYVHKIGEEEILYTLEA